LPHPLNNTRPVQPREHHVHKEGFRISMEKTHKSYFVYRQNTPRSTNGETKKRKKFRNQTAIFFMGTLQKIIELEI
jgi:hypothetical protein